MTPSKTGNDQLDEQTLSTLRALRALHPKRALTLSECKAVAARQANRLRVLHDSTQDFAFDTDIIAQQPRVLIDLDNQITAAGSTHWTGTHWRVLINAGDSPQRRRFTLAHQYKHIIDHGAPVDPDFEEMICDHFAACLLMPKPKILAAWTNPDLPQRIDAMAELFAVSPQAMRFRLHDLGVLERSTRPRCPGLSRRRLHVSARPNQSIYYRTQPITQVVGTS